VSFLPEIIAVANQKGGVGKTTLSVNLSSGISHLLAEKGKKVLIVDSDHQANATYLLTREEVEYSRSLASIYQDELFSQPGRLILGTSLPNLDLVPASPFMASEEMKLTKREKKGERLRLFLDAVGKDYSLIFIDCPPAINLFVLNAFYAATKILVPLPPEDLAIQGFRQLMSQVHAIRGVNRRLSFLGVILNMFTERVLVQKEIRYYLEEEFAEKLLGIIHRSVKIQEAEAMRMTLLEYAPRSRSFRENQLLSRRILEELGLVKNDSKEI